MHDRAGFLGRDNRNPWSSHLLTISSMAFLAVLLVLPAGVLGIDSSKGHQSSSLMTSSVVLGTNASGPSPRFGVMMAYYPPSKEVVMFGGQLSAPGTSPYNWSNETWVFYSNAWHQLHPPASPTARGFGAMAYDARDHYVVMFGGYFGSKSLAQVNDTWAFSNGTWRNITPAHSPATRNDNAMTYDIRDGYVLLYGGVTSVNGSSFALSDTWSFAHGAWTEIGSCGAFGQPGCGTSAPSVGWSPSMAYNSTTANGRVVLFGGACGAPCKGPGATDYTWTYQGGKWKNITSSLLSSPPGLVGAGLAPIMTPYGGRLILFGGTTSSSVWQDSTWRFQPGRWVNVTSSLSVSPPPRGGWSFGMVSDSTHNRVIIFGGVSCNGPPYGSCTMLNDTWSFRTGVWTQL